MLTQPDTPAREKEVDELLSGVRRLLIAGTFEAVEVIRHTDETEHPEGYRHYSHNGSFTLKANHVKAAQE